MKKEIFFRVNEIFYSIQGEASRSGMPCIFIRFAGCDLSCSYCDTTYAKTTGMTMTPKRIINSISAYPCRNICLTGGEPLQQENLNTLVSMLLRKKYSVSIETNGCRNISKISRNVHFVMDIKCPGSGQDKQNIFKNLDSLKKSDDVKFVVTDRQDYEWAGHLIRKKKLNDKFNVFLSPVHGNLKPEKLAEWLLKDGLAARLQLQLHKLIKVK